MRKSYLSATEDYRIYGVYTIFTCVVVISASLAGSLKDGVNILQYPLFNKSMLIQVAAVVIFTSWLLQRGFTPSLQHMEFRRSPFDLNLILLFGWALLSLAWAAIPGHAVVGLLQWITVGMLMFVAFQSFRSDSDVQLLLAAFFFAGVTVAAIGILQTLTQFDVFFQVVSPASTFGNKNMAMHLVVLVFPAGIFLFINDSSSLRGKSLATAGLAVLLAYTLFTVTRAAWVVLTLEMVALLILQFYFRRTGRHTNFERTHWVALCLGLAVLIGLLGMRAGGLASTAIIAVEGISRAAGEAGNDTYIRYAIWQSTLDIALRQWVTGVGLNNYEYTFPMLDASERLAVLQHAHQDYLQLFMDLGGVGLLLLAWLLVKIVMVCRRLLVRTDAKDSLILMTVIVAFTGTMVNALFSFPFQLALPQLVAGLYLSVLAWLNERWAPKGSAKAYRPSRAAVKVAGLAALPFLLLVVQIEYQWLHRIGELRQFATGYAASFPSSRVWLRHPTYERMLQDLTTGLLDARQYDKASAVLENELVALRPRHAYVRELQIEANLGKRRWAAAIGNIREHLGLFPPSVQNLQRARLVHAHLRLGQSGLAAQALRDAHADMLRQTDIKAPAGTYRWLGRLALEMQELSLSRDFGDRAISEASVK